MSRRAVALLAILCLACAATAAAAAAAPKGYATPTFHKYMIDARFGQLPTSPAAGGKASVASTATQDAAVPAFASEADYYHQYGYDNYRESKQICLAEQRQRNCGMYGCECAPAAVEKAVGFASAPHCSNNCAFRGATCLH
jgi:hypothetical protein